VTRVMNLTNDISSPIDEKDPFSKRSPVPGFGENSYSKSREQC
jgi:hypothetical protein